MLSATCKQQMQPASTAKSLDHDVHSSGDGPARLRLSTSRREGGEHVGHAAVEQHLAPIGPKITAEIEELVRVVLHNSRPFRPGVDLRHLHVRLGASRCRHQHFDMNSAHVLNSEFLNVWLSSKYQNKKLLCLASSVNKIRDARRGAWKRRKLQCQINQCRPESRKASFRRSKPSTPEVSQGTGGSPTKAHSAHLLRSPSRTAQLVDLLHHSSGFGI